MIAPLISSGADLAIAIACGIYAIGWLIMYAKLAGAAPEATEPGQETRTIANINRAALWWPRAVARRFTWK